MITDEALARVIHAANSAYNVWLEDPAPDGPYDVLPAWHKEMILSRVEMIRKGYGPESIHQEWVDYMTREMGWRLGEVKDPVAKAHPCLQDWRKLPPEQQRKDTMAIAIVKNLIG